MLNWTLICLHLDFVIDTQQMTEASLLIQILLWNHNYSGLS